VGQALVEQLEGKGISALTLETDLDAAAVQQRCQHWLEQGEVMGVYWLPALDVEPGLDELTLESWRELLRRRVKLLHAAMRALIAAGETSPFLVAGTRMGGLHGYEARGAAAPAGGAVAGFTKAYGRERDGVLTKVLDFEAHRPAQEVADALLAETEVDPGVVEVGFSEGRRYSLALQQRSAVDGEPGLILDEDTVFVVTGAAGGIVCAIVADLAEASGGAFYLLDLAKEPRADDPRIALFREDRSRLRDELIASIKEEGDRPTPKMVEQRLFAVERQEAALRAVEAVEAAGGTAYYHSVDLRDGAAVAAVMEQVRGRHGRLDVMIHGGGVEISHELARKEPQEFDLVFDVKADGMFNLLAGARDLDPGAVVAFSSVAGRFGNAGQTDYSAANDLLCKLTSSLRNSETKTRGVAIDWTAWSDIGMATRGSIPKIMAQAGIEMLSPETGIPTVRRELTRGATRDEIVVGRGLGALLSERDPHGGLDQQAASENSRVLMVGQVTGAKLHGGLRARTTLDPRQQPFLSDHQVESGLAYLPGVMGMESFAQLAAAAAPGLHVTAMEDVRFSAPFKFYRDEPRELLLGAVVSRHDDGQHTALTSLESVTGLEARIKTHFTAVVHMAAEPAAEPVPAPAPALEAPRTMDREQIYQALFHGPAYRVLERVDLAGDTALGHWARDLPPDTAPTDAYLLWAPRLVELCFQTAGVWQLARDRPMGLPQAVESVKVHTGLPEDGEELCAVVTARQDGATFDARVVGPGGRVHLTVTGYHTTAG